MPRIIPKNFRRSKPSLAFLSALALLVAAQPAWTQLRNDAFASRTLISGAGAAIFDTIGGATSEPGEPAIAGVSSGQTAWWTWTAPSNGIVRFTTFGNGFQPLLSVYTGAELPNLSLVASNVHQICYTNTLCGCHWRARPTLLLHVERGQAYQIAVDSPVITDSAWRWILGASPELSFWESVRTTNVAPAGPMSLRLEFTPAPRNDDFANRVRLSGSRPRVRASNTGATKEAGEPEHLGNPGGSSVWYSWTASASGRVTLSMNEIPPYRTFGLSDTYTLFNLGIGGPSCGVAIDQNPLPSFFPVFTAYTGSTLDSLRPANCLPLQLRDYPHAVAFDAVQGQTYQISFDGNGGTTGDTPLYLALTQPAVNDRFERRIRLRGAMAAATGHNAGATAQPGESASIHGSTGKTVWWSWKAPVNGTVSVDLGGSDYAFPVSVLAGASVSNLVVLASGTNRVTFEAIAGQTYELAVGDANGLTGAIRLRLQAPIVEVPLLSASARGNSALLRYAAEPRQVILLVRSTDGTNWENVRVALARRSEITFLARPAPGATGPPFYRAIVFDLLD